MHYENCLNLFVLTDHICFIYSFLRKTEVSKKPSFKISEKLKDVFLLCFIVLTNYCGK